MVSDSQINLAPADLIQALRGMGLAAADERPACHPLAGGVSSEIWRVDLRRGPVCVKRALARLRVATEWCAPVERWRYEVAWLERAARIVPGAVPALLGRDEARKLFAMEFLPPDRYPVWKTALQRGDAAAAFAAHLGRVLVALHAATAGRAEIAAAFPTDAIFQAIRLDPYLGAIARAYPDLAAPIDALRRRTAETKLALVHGDVSPKNILIGPAGPVLLDAECAWYGDPAFDLAFCLTHLLLKTLWVPAAARGFLNCFAALATAYLAGVDWERPEAVEARAASLLPALLLARVDGKSPVDYLDKAADKERVRRVGRVLIAAPPQSLSGLRDAWAKELGLA